MPLRTDYQYREPLTHDEINEINHAINDNTGAVSANASQIAQVSTTVTQTQDLVVQNQQGVADLKPALAANAASLAQFQSLILNAENRLTALEGGSPPAVANPPTLGTPASITNTSVSIPFTAPVSGPAPTGYLFQWAGPSGVFGPTPPQAVASSPASITGLSQGTSYRFHAASNNAVGPSALSNEVTATTTASYTPSAAWSNIPAQSSLTMDDGGVVTLQTGVVYLTPLGGVIAPMGITGSVDLIVKADTGRIFVRETGNWWYWNPANGTWVSSADPRPVIPGNNTPRQRLLTYLQSISGNHVLSGQNTDTADQDYNAVVSGIGISPAMIAYDPYMHQWAGNFIYDPSFVDNAIAKWNNGHGCIVGVGFAFPNPHGDGSYGDGTPVDPVQALTPGTATYNGIIALLNSVATDILIPLKNAGLPIIVRYEAELDGSWFWWGTGGWGRFNGAQQTELFRMMKNYFDGRGLDNLLHTFAISGAGPWTYPGDDLVDIVGIDAYTDDPAGVYTGLYNSLRSAAPSRLIVLSEWGSGTPAAGDPAFNTQVLIDAIKGSMPRICYVNAWLGTWTWNNETNAAGGLSDPYVINQPGVVLP